MRRRNIHRALAEALADTPVVFVQGPRQAGKTTLVRALCAEEGRAYVTFDEATALSAAQADPRGFVAGLPERVAIDEVQRVPEIFLAIKAAVDADRQPGRFLLTGSASVLVLPRLADALVGRMEVVTLWPFSQSEIEGRRDAFVDALFGADLPTVRGSSRAEILGRLVAGGYPEASGREASRRGRWYESYLVTLLQRDVRDLANVADLAAMPRLLALIGARSSNLLNASDLGVAVGLPQTTLRRYLALLEGTFLVGLIPAWASNRGQRLVKAPKIVVHDSGLLAHLLGLREEWPETLVGPLFESFAIGEILRAATWSHTRPRLHHFRNAGGREVDVVLEDARGRVAGVEVKASATVQPRDLGGMRALADAAGDRFHRGIVLYAGPDLVPLGPRLHAVPLPALWRW